MIRGLAILTLAVALTGCGTIDGVGQDISGAARTVQGWFR
ncbi:entericidin EcnA/B family protein [Rhodosalinus sp.]